MKKRIMPIDIGTIIYVPTPDGVITCEVTEVCLTREGFIFFASECNNVYSYKFCFNYSDKNFLFFLDKNRAI